MNRFMDFVIGWACGVFMVVALILIERENKQRSQQDDWLEMAYIKQLDCYCYRAHRPDGLYFINQKKDTVAIIFKPYKVIEWEINK